MSASRPALRITDYEAQLAVPFVSAQGSYARRAGLLLRIAGDPSGAVAEASPLPGYCSDSRDDAARYLSGLAASQLATLLAASNARELAERLRARLTDAPAAARFALETLLFDRLSRTRGQPLWQVLAELAGSGAAGEPARSAQRSVPLCAVIPIEAPARVARRTAQLASLGVRSFKLKIGPHRVSEPQLDATRAVRRTAGDATIRWDANGTLWPDQWPTLEGHARSLGVDFLEEPWRPDHAPWPVASACPLALDESLQRPGSTVERTLGEGRCAGLVLKPTALAGLLACLDWACRARRENLWFTVSHCLEGPVGWLSCAHLALALQPRRAAGLWPMAHQRAGAQPLLAGGHLALPERPGLGDPAAG